MLHLWQASCCHIVLQVPKELPDVQMVQGHLHLASAIVLEMTSADPFYRPSGLCGCHGRRSSSCHSRQDFDTMAESASIDTVSRHLAFDP